MGTTMSDADQILAAVERVRLDIEEENRKRDVRIRSNNRAVHTALIGGAVATLVAILAVVVAFVAVNAAHDSRDALRAAQADAQVARVNACKQYNDQADRNRTAFIDNATVLVGQVKDPTPEQQASIARYVAKQKARSVVNFPHRDCTTKGIANYLTGHGGYLPSPTTAKP